MKQTKIIATIGPASWDVPMLVKLVEAGVNIARINFSHGDEESLSHIVDKIRKAEKQIGKKIEILQDLSGPKIRTGDFVDGEIYLKKGSHLIIHSENILGNNKEFSISYPNLFSGLKKGERIFLNDGKQELKILEKDDKKLKVEVLRGGKIVSRRGVNLPDSNLTVSSLTEKDKKDLEFAKKFQPDYIALSFVKDASSVEELRKILKEKKIKAKIISKIETKSAVNNLKEIISSSDAVMVARGDLGVEIGFEKVPLVQKKIINICNRTSVPEIVATQMLESMIHSPVPTRAEVSDVYNAVQAGADMVMLSAETATGEFPLEAVKMMAKVIREAENNIF